MLDRVKYNKGAGFERSKDHERVIRKRDGQIRIGSVNPFSPRGPPLTSKNYHLVLYRVKYDKGAGFEWSKDHERVIRKRVGQIRIGSVNPFSPRGSPLKSKIV